MSSNSHLSVALMFPGQGSQYAGMGLKLTGESARYLEIADRVLGYSLSSLMKEGPEEELKLTHNAQPAILTHSIALYSLLSKELAKRNIKISCVLGHSVGEFAGLVAAGAIRFEDALMAVHLRGRYMQEAVPPGVGKMIAIMKASEENVKMACLHATTQINGKESKVMPANFNGPDQIVISGHSEACLKAVEWLKANTEEKFRAIELNVSAPFHSSLMAPAKKQLAAVFQKIEFCPTIMTYIANIDAKEYPPKTTPEMVKKNLLDQIEGSVLWNQSVSKLPSHIKCFEVGPSKVLQGLAKKINPDLAVCPLDQGQSEEIPKFIQEFLT